MKIAIVDDFASDRSKLHDALCRIMPEYGITLSGCDEFESGEAFLRRFAAQQYDLIFLDVYMNSLSGIDTARAIRQLDTEASLVLITTSNSFASESYEVRALYYLLKPFSDEDIRRMLYAANLESKQKERIVELPDGTPVLLCRILYTDYSNHRVTVYFDGGVTKQIWSSQQQMEEILCTREEFATCTKGMIVNLEWINRMDERIITLKNGVELPVARARRSELKSRHANYLFSRLRRGGV